MLRRTVVGLVAMCVGWIVAWQSAPWLYERWSEHVYDGIWGRSAGHDPISGASWSEKERDPGILLWATRPADERYLRAYGAASVRAIQQGLVFKASPVSQTTRFAHWSKTVCERSPIGQVSKRDGHIIVDTQKTATMTDEELEMLMAHEIGHLVDDAMTPVCRSHPVLAPWCDMDQEQFADGVAMQLYGFPEYHAFFMKYIRVRLWQEPIQRGPKPAPAH